MEEDSADPKLASSDRYERAQTLQRYASRTIWNVGREESIGHISAVAQALGSVAADKI